MGSKVKSVEYYHSLANRVHNGKYDYSEWDSHISIHTKVKIICPDHGEFLQTVANHTRGAGCPVCRRHKRASGFNKKPVTHFISKAATIHNNFYDYSKWEDVQNTSLDLVTIICPIHGEFKQTPASHIDKKAGCPKCSIHQRRITCKNKYGVNHPSQQHLPSHVLDKLNDADWLATQHAVHQRTLEDIALELKVQDTTVGRYFKQHDLKVKRFAKSVGESELHDWITKLDNISTIPNDRTAIYPKELDVYLPDSKLGIEYCGLYWHSDIYKNVSYHATKHRVCEKNGIRLITLFEDEWKYNKDLVKQKILSILGNDSRPTIYARKCTVIPVNQQLKKDFFNKYHIQGNGPGSISIGLQCDNELVACMTFIKQKNGKFILNRYATSAKVPGGFSKLLSYFKKQHSWTEIVSFADLRWSQGDLYYKNGFVLDKVLPPDYAYIINGQRVHKFNFRHKFLNNLLEHYDPTLSEKQNCDNNNVLRIWDCGKKRFVINNS